MIRVLLLCLLSAAAIAQDWTTVTASHLTTAASVSIAGGKFCFLGTDDHDRPIGFRAGDGTQVVATAACTAIRAGAIAAGFKVANPDRTSPLGIYYRVTIVVAGSTVRTEKLVQISGATFDFDSYAPSATVNGLVYQPGPGVPAGGDTKQVLRKKSAADLDTEWAASPGGDFSLNVENPATADSGKFQHELKVASSLQEISCDVDAGTAQINFEVRSEATPNSSGAAVLTTPLLCTATGGSTTTFAAPSIAAGAPIALAITDVSGATLLRVHVHVQSN
jgi:hypothetical protein